MNLAIQVADSGHTTIKPPPLSWRNGHYNRASLFRIHGFVRCAVSPHEPELLRNLGLLRIFTIVRQPVYRHKRANPRYLKVLDNPGGRPLTIGFDPLSGDLWVREGHYDLCKPPFCFTNIYDEVEAMQKS